MNQSDHLGKILWTVAPIMFFGSLIVGMMTESAVCAIPFFGSFVVLGLANLESERRETASIVQMNEEEAARRADPGEVADG